MIIDFSKDIDINSLFPKTGFEEKVISFFEDFFKESKTVSVQTSGSTGVPKIFEVEKEKMFNSAKMTCNFLGLKKGNTALLCLPTEYISGKMMMVRSIERKLKLIITEPSAKPLEDVSKKIDFCAMTPLQVENSLDKIHLIKKLIIGGAQVSENLIKKISQTLELSNSQTKIFETYGMSETLSHVALKQIFPNEEAIFTTFDGIEISQDERNCLKINAPKLNSEILQTNDIVEIINDKEFKFLGRIDNVINSGGAKIFPEELEALVKKEIPHELVFLGIPDEVLGQKLVLIVEEIRIMDQELRNEDLKFKIQNLKFPKSFHKPKEIIYVDKIPRTENGKVNRTALLEEVENF